MLQVFLVIGVTGGAVLSAGLSSSIGSVKGVSVPDALIGGVLMLWGSRFASGCTRCVVNIELIHVFEKKTPCNTVHVQIRYISFIVIFKFVHVNYFLGIWFYLV